MDNMQLAASLQVGRQQQAQKPPIQQLLNDQQYGTWMAKNKDKTMYDPGIFSYLYQGAKDLFGGMTPKPQANILQNAGNPNLQFQQSPIISQQSQPPISNSGSVIRPPNALPSMNVAVPKVIPQQDTNKDFQINYLKNALGEQESNNRYDALGVKTKSGYQALGKYQIMEQYVADYTKKFFGKALNRAQFLANKEAQEAVMDGLIKHHMKNGLGMRDIISKHFTGQLEKVGKNRVDATSGKTGRSYIDDVVDKYKKYSKKS